MGRIRIRPHKGKEKLFTLLLSTIMIPFAVVLVPRYITIAHLKMANHLSGIIVTGLEA